MSHWASVISGERIKEQDCVEEVPNMNDFGGYFIPL